MRISPVYSSSIYLSSRQTQHPRFGLKGDALKNHPNYHRKLVLGEDVVISKVHTLLPTDKLIQEVADVVLKDGLQDPRALVITNITDFFDKFDYTEGSRDFETVRAFQRKLFDEAWVRIKKARYSNTTEKDFSSVYVEFEDGPRNRKGNPNPEDPAFMKTPKIKFPLFRTYHFDSDDVLVGLSYGPIREVKGGNLKFFDFEQFMKDKKLTFRELFHPFLTEVASTHFLRGDFMDEVIDPYEFQVQTKGKTKTIVPIIFFNNQSVIHGPSPTIPNSTEFVEGIHKRLLYRTSIKPNRLSQYWQLTDPVPFHVNYYHTNKRPKP
ncbi:MAG: hypothetical protein KTR14_02530 [Vampirovibrio sp.]|nr:hypothetical protein [Vampirovibrio sp.]